MWSFTSVPTKEKRFHIQLFVIQFIKIVTALYLPQNMIGKMFLAAMVEQKRQIYLNFIYFFKY